ncbi:MAG: PAS domain-containing sensor histidine kinase [Candidatus Riflebacteria bacterium]|nr:PAS domain-containing sensor histidine kinase [Candidatus Riflebacteria bacterium]
MRKNNLDVVLAQNGECKITLTDITELKDAEMRRLNEARYLSIIEDQTELICRYAPDGKLTFVNSAYARYYGKKPEELINMNFLPHIPEPDMTMIISKLAEISPEKPAVALEHRIITTDDELRWQHWTHRGIYDSFGNIVEHQAVGRDITSQKRSEEELKKSQSRLKRAHQSAHLGNWEWDIITNERYWSEENYRILGIPPRQDKHSFEALLQVIDPVEREFVEKAVSDAVTSGKSLNIDFSIIKPDNGEKRFINSKADVIMDSSGKAVKMIGTIQDITERKKAETNLCELNLKLEQRVDQEMAKRLDKEHMLIQQSKMAAMGEMIGAIAHQWRQPLNALGLIIQGIQHTYEYGELNKEHLEKVVGKGMKQIQFMSKTIDDFRNFFKSDKNAIDFDVKTAMGEVLSLVSGQLKSNNISYSLTCKNHKKTFDKAVNITTCCEMTIHGFKNEFEQVFLNIIGNAKDSITECQHKNKNHEGVISIEVERVGENVIISVNDNGCGIPQNVIDRIFEPYFTTKDQGKGTGIGLYMAKMIIEEHMGGSISARNTGNGAEFRIELVIAKKKHGRSQSTINKED